jgi:hypothetical protein
MIGQDKIEFLKGIIDSKGHTPERREALIKNVNPNWLTLDQDADEIARQFSAAMLFDGLGEALLKYVAWAEKQY